MNLIQTIEELDPGHFKRREDILEDFRTKVRNMGFFPLPLSWNDIECFWIRLEGKNGKPHNITSELVQDALILPNLMEVLKEVMKYERKD